MSVIVDGAILAAGVSSRMQKPKPLLEVGAETFLQRGIDTLRSAGCRTVYVVANAQAEWAQAAADELGFELVVNPQLESEQVDSVRMVVERLPADTRGLLVLPVDLPLVSASTAQSMVRAFTAEPGPLFLPFHNGVAGHPVLLGRELFDDVLNKPLTEGIRSLIMAHARDLREVTVIDPGVLIDIDTPDDYWRYVESK
ncbi:nucleotidyltransferase family protein [soil metagenome]